jgi:mRNA interferase RelE/StbE
MLKLDLSKQASKFLETLPPKQFKQVMGTILALLKNPCPVDSEKLTGYDYRRKDIGEYRIVYRFENDEIKVAITRKRNDDEVYKLLKSQS